MDKKETSIYTEVLKELMGKKSYHLSKANALSDVGMNDTAQLLYLSAAAYEERIAALLDIQGQELEAAIHRISTAACYEKAGELSSAVNLYRAALAGPLADKTRTDVLAMLNDCLQVLAQKPIPYFTTPPRTEVLAA